MYNRIVIAAVLVPVGIVLVALAVANRAGAAFTLDPFNPGNPALTVELPLFVLLFAALGAGVIIGSLATWLGQGRYRKAARRLKQTQPAAAAVSPGKAVAARPAA